MTREAGVAKGSLLCVIATVLWYAIRVTSALCKSVGAAKGGKWFKLGYYFLPKRNGSIDRSPTGRFRSSI
jgi:hypothetical protein